MARTIHGTLVPNQITTVNLDPYASVEVLSRNGAGEIYFRCDGIAPAIGGIDNYVVVAGISATRATTPGGSATAATVQMISVSAVTFTVTGGS